ncbi:MAG: Arc family DNA-binding protein [Spirochaetia bacterium]|nr:Arc family DNA-binding protein [Spirochaetia bacterium]
MEPKDKEKGKKQLLLRLSPTLWKELAIWAEDDFRSINGQIEYLLTECVRKRRKKDMDNSEGTDTVSLKDTSNPLKK